MKMNRRNLLLGIAAVPIAGTANALSWSDIKEAITGHVDDIIDRRKDDTFAPGHPYAMSTFREDDIGQDAAHWVRGDVYLMSSQGTNYVVVGVFGSINDIIHMTSYCIFNIAP